MKRIVFLFTALLLTAAFAGCGGRNEAGSIGIIGGDDGPTAIYTTDGGSEGTEDRERYSIGIYQHVDHPSLSMIHEAIVERLAEQGYGPDVVDIDYRSAQGDASTLNTISQTFVGDGKDILVAIATNTAQSAAAATDDIPIVFAAVADPVGALLVERMDAPPTGNITGTSHAVPVEDIFAMAEVLTPGAQTWGLVYNPGEVSAQSTIAAAKEYLDAQGLEYVEGTLSNTSELQQATLSLVGSVDAIFVPNDNTVASAMPVLAQAAVDNGIPVYCSADTMVMDGGLATIGVDFARLGRQTADMIVRILEGTPVSEVPPEKFTDFTTMINPATAEQLGVDPGLIPGAELVNEAA